MSIRISQWSGRLGNNILQLTGTLNYCKIVNSNLIMPEHNIITKTEINLNGENNIEEEDVYYFYDVSIVSDDERRKLGREYVLPIINHRNITLTNNDLVIHLRGGDIFVNNPPNNYVQAPISYVEKIIQIENPTNIIIVYEDLSNPSVEYLINNYNNIILVNDLIDGISYILSAKKLVVSGVGTFARGLIMCSNNIEKVYVPAFLKKDGDNIHYDTDCCVDYSDLEIIKINIPNYIEANNWDWNDEIKNLFITHRF